jgi:uncharacterized protein YjbI with pentapeptide repeats
MQALLDATKTGTSLHNADLRHTEIYEDEIKGADLSGADFTGPVLSARTSLVPTFEAPTSVTHACSLSHWQGLT